jgi:hypothetical protein
VTVVRSQRSPSGSELPFSGSKINYMALKCWTSATTKPKFFLWAATANEAGNEAFNVVNGDTESSQNLWSPLASRFECKVLVKTFPGIGEEHQDFRADYDGVAFPAAD